ncbi:MAG TPA: hypothetical protein ENO03_08015, partial [Candidatus Aminicenantes bacterium]|nr:hypothetical protein [Candidatus Aminicenantes bacterium]
MSKAVRAGVPLALTLALLGAAGPGRQAPAPIGYISTDRVVELAAAADGSMAADMPSPDALASLVALMDPVHLRVFLCASRPADLKVAASVGKAAEAAGNPALSVEFIAVAEDLSE